MSIEEEAADLRISLQVGLVSVGDVVAWADRWIFELDEPPQSLLDLSMLSKASPPDLDSKLSQLAGAVPVVQALRMALRRVNGALAVDPNLAPAIVRGLYDIYVELNYDVPPEMSEIGALDDAFTLAATGTYGTYEEALERLASFARAFEG